MLALQPSHAPLRVLVVRAGAGYVLLRLLLVVVAALLTGFAGPEAGDALTSPLGTVLIAAALGHVDVGRRGERIFWANLGYSTLVAPALFGTAAIAGETVLVWFRS
jgi:hypothetical protein